MPVYIDAKEKNCPTLKANGIHASLTYDVEGKTYFYDFAIVPADGGPAIHGERKVFPSDFLGSWWGKDAEGRAKLERQLSAVDVLIVEFDPLETMKIYGVHEPKKLADIKDRMYKHLANLSFKMPVLYSDSEEQTWRILEYLERSPHAIAPRLPRHQDWFRQKEEERATKATRRKGTRKATAHGADVRPPAVGGAGDHPGAPRDGATPG